METATKPCSNLEFASTNYHSEGTEDVPENDQSVNETPSRSTSRRKLFSSSRAKNISNSFRKVKKKLGSKKKSSTPHNASGEDFDAIFKVQEPIRRQGWMLVRDQWRWRKRYAILFHNRLEYFVERGDREPRGTLILGRDFTVEMASSRRGSTPSSITQAVVNGEVSAHIKGGLSNIQDAKTLKRAGSLTRSRLGVGRGTKKHIFRFKVGATTLLKLACKDGAEAEAWVKLLQDSRGRPSRGDHSPPGGSLDATMYFETDMDGARGSFSAPMGGVRSRRDSEESLVNETAEVLSQEDSGLESDGDDEAMAVQRAQLEAMRRNEWVRPLLSKNTLSMMKPPIRRVAQQVPVEVVADPAYWSLLGRSGDQATFVSSSAVLTRANPGGKAYKTECTVCGDSNRVFRLLLDLSDDRRTWDSTFDVGEVLRSLDDHTDLVHVVSQGTSTKSSVLFNLPVSVAARERVLYRYWFRSQDTRTVHAPRADSFDALLQGDTAPANSYVVYYTSVRDPSLHTARPWGTVFSTAHWGVLLIEPAGEGRSKVTLASHMELGGWVEVFSQLAKEKSKATLLRRLIEQPIASLAAALDSNPDLDVDGARDWDPEDPHGLVDFLNLKSHQRPVRLSGDAGADRGDSIQRTASDVTHRLSCDTILSEGALETKPKAAKAGELDYEYPVPESTVVVPMGQSADRRSCWWDSGTEKGFWKVRGPDYLDDRVKVPSQVSAMELVQMQWSFYEEPKMHISQDPDELMQREHVGRSDRPFMFVVNFLVPTIGNYVCYFARRRGQKPGTFDRMLDDFRNGSDEYRNSRFKIIPSVVEGYYIVKRSVGNKPGIIGKKLNTTYFQGENYFEVCVDVGSSKVAKGLMGLVKTYCASLVIDLAFLFESQDPTELPENILGGCRIRFPSMKPKKKQAKRGKI